jgi:hypothetical protein
LVLIMQVLSPTAPILLGFEPEEATKICRLSNEYIATLTNNILINSLVVR